MHKSVCAVKIVFMKAQRREREKHIYLRSPNSSLPQRISWKSLLRFLLSLPIHLFIPSFCIDYNQSSILIICKHIYHPLLENKPIVGSAKLFFTPFTLITICM